MGAICPCSRERRSKSISKEEIDAPADSPQADLSQHGTPSPQPTQVWLRSEEKVTRLLSPLSHFYQTLGETKSETTCTVLIAEFRSTKQACLIQTVPKTTRTNKTRFKTDLFEKLNKLVHPHILRMYEMFQDTKHLYIVSEISDAGRVDEYIAREGGMSERRAATAIHEVLSALAYAHSLGIVHGSVNERTVVVKNDPGLNIIDVKIGGFENTDIVGNFTEPGNATPRKSRTDEKFDILCCGVLLVYFLTGKNISSDLGSPHLFKKIALAFPLLSDVWATLSPDLLSFLEAMLNTNAAARPSALDCIAHPWIRRFSLTQPITCKSVRIALTNLRENAPKTSVMDALAWFLITRVIKDSEISKLAETFRTLDRNGDGLISEEELLFAFRKILPEEKATDETKKVMAKADKNQNGYIDYSEFLLSSFSQSQIMTHDNLKAAFRTLDVDNSGVITMEELQRFFVVRSKKKGEGEWKKLLGEFDRSGESINFGKFQAVMNRAFTCVTESLSVPATFVRRFSNP